MTKVETVEKAIQAVETVGKIPQIKEEILNDKRIDGNSLMAVLEIFAKYDV